MLNYFIIKREIKRRNIQRAAFEHEIAEISRTQKTVSMYEIKRLSKLYDETCHNVEMKIYCGYVLSHTPCGMYVGRN